MKRVCTKCKIEKELSEFNKQIVGKFGHSPSCRECTAKRAKANYLKNKEAELNRSRIYYLNNKDSVYARHKNYEMTRKQTDLNFKLAKNLRARLSMAIRTVKISSAVRDLGCSMDELRLHLENKFRPGMSWENYGDWHIDHIRALATFDLTNKVQAKAASHYLNLQPLWAQENRMKGAA